MSESECTDIPIVDLTPLALTPAESLWNPDNADPEVVADLAAQIFRAFTTIGFVYFKGHGVPQKQVDAVTECTAKFFALPNEAKSQYVCRGEDGAYYGWFGMQEEGLDVDSSPDHKEVYNVTPAMAKFWPDPHVTGFKDTTMDLFSSSQRLAEVVLHLMAVGLGLKDPRFFVRQHNPSSRMNYTTLRSILYPALPPDFKNDSGVLRCGEHSDWASITLLYQDDEGGLEVFSKRQNQYVPVPPIEGAIVVNIGDCMQRWTSDVFVSTRHRVVLPGDEQKKRRARRSHGFFAVADHDCVVTCADGSDKYEPITVVDYINMKFMESQRKAAGSE